MTTNVLARRLGTLPGAPLAPYAGLAVLAFLVRLGPLLSGAGLGGYGRYDDGVYYAAADALTLGRVPYHNFYLLHPPGIALVLAPIALLGHVTSDATAMTVGRLVFMGIGAANAVLVAHLARRWGWAAAVTGGVLYAVWMPAVYDEQTTLLEPLGTTALLVALLFLFRRDDQQAVRHEIVAGIVLGLAVALKIWYVAPWAAVVIWLLIARRLWSALRVVVAGGIALLVVLLPFIVLAGRRMFDMVVRDQVLRPDNPKPRLDRLQSIFGVGSLIGNHRGALVDACTAIAIVLLLLAAARCLRDPMGRVLVWLLVVNLAVLLSAPSYFAHYAELTAAPAALIYGGALGLALQRPALQSLRPVTVGLVVVLLLGYGWRIATITEGKPLPGARFAAAAPAGCVASDDPQALIQMNRLTRDLQLGCRLPVDVTGITYDTLHRVLPDGRQVPRRLNAAFQDWLYHYLVSARSFVVARRAGDALAPDIRHALDRHPALARGDGLVLRAGDGGP